MQIVFQDPYASLNPRLTVRRSSPSRCEIHGLEQDGPRTGSASCWRWSASTPSTPTATRTSSPAASASASASPGPCRSSPSCSCSTSRCRPSTCRSRPGRQPARGPAGPAGAGLPVHRPRPVGGAPHLRPGGGDVPRQDRRDRRRPTRSTSRPRTRTPRRCCRRCRCPTRARSGSAQRIVLEGDVPSPADPPSGCRFRTRCWKAAGASAPPRSPSLEDRGQGHPVACHFAEAPRSSDPAGLREGSPADRGSRGQTANLVSVMSERSSLGALRCCSVP